MKKFPNFHAHWWRSYHISIILQRHQITNVCCLRSQMFIVIKSQMFVVFGLILLSLLEPAKGRYSSKYFCTSLPFLSLPAR